MALDFNEIQGHDCKRGVSMKPLKQKVSLTLDEDLIAKLRVLAENCDRSLSQYINVTLKEHVAKLEQEKTS